MRRISSVVCLLLLSGCAGGPPDRTAASGATNDALLAAVYYYRGHTVGKANRPTGLAVSEDGGTSWRHPGWHELISSSPAVDASGRWVYLACGNGVMVSDDAGQTWRLTGGWEMTEVQRVCIDRRNPRKAWAATAYGVFATDDILARGNPWRPLDAGEAFRYTSDVMQDAADADRLWVAAEVGVFTSPDGGRTFTPAVADARVRRVAHDRTNPQRIWAATDGRGLLESTDGGQSWRRVSGSPDVVFCVEQDARDAGMIHCGAPSALWTRDGDGAWQTRGDGAWQTRGDGLGDGFLVYDVLCDPSQPGRLLVSGNDGVYSCGPGADEWTLVGFAGASVPDLCAARLADMPPRSLDTTPGTLQLRETGTALAEHRDERPDGFEARRAEMIAHFTEQPRRARVSFLHALHRIREGHADAKLWDGLREQLGAPRASMFYSMQAMALYLHCREMLPDDLRDRFREVLTTEPVYRGDTENHWVMHYTALLLATEAWPETPAARWYAGRSTQELHDEARGWLEHWARLTARKGQGEFDSPTYLFMYVTPMLLLYDFAREPEMKQLAGMVLDLLFADYFAESLDGAWGGGHSRATDQEVQLGRTNRVAAYHFLYAGGTRLAEKVHPWFIVAAHSSYRPPDVLRAIANRRDRPYVHTEVKRVRNVIRYGDALNPPVHKYTYMTPRYCLGSLQGGILQPVQQHTWDVTWSGSAPNATLFALHPSISARELAMFFPEEVHDLTRSVSAQKSSYASPDKLVSSSPWERVFQHENVLLALYAVPPGERFAHATLYVPTCLERTDQDGWHFGRDGDFFVAWYALREGTWKDRGDHAVFRCPADRAGFVVITSPREHVGAASTPREEARSFEQFRAFVARCGRPTLEGEGEKLRLALRYADGRVIARVFGEDAGTIDGQPVPFPSASLFRGPFIRSEAGSGVIRLTDGTVTRTLDFNEMKIGQE